MRQISLLMVVHHHQPAGEEDDVIARAVDAAYRPLLEALWAFPNIRAAMALTGVLPEWLEANDAPFLDRLRPLVERGQVEMLGGAHWGAPLHAIPDRDALVQLQHHQAWLQRRLGASPRAVWLADGAWDGCAPRLLARVGASITFLDEALIAASGHPGTPEGWYVAEREGTAVGVLPLDRELSQMMPWSSPRVFMSALQERAARGAQLAVVAVAGEQLGVHPHSARWCWARERGWIRRFFETIRAQDYWLRTTLPGMVLQRTRPRGRAAPASGTPPEVGVAALEIGEGRALQRRVRAVDDRLPGLTGANRWVVGPPWEACLVRFDEANRLHKRVLRTSLVLHMARKKLKERAESATRSPEHALLAASEALLRVQGASFYHGGPGGGLLRPEIRHRAWRDILRAEHTVRGLLGDSARMQHEVADHDCDGQREVLLQTPYFSAVVRPAMGGALTEVGLWELGNLLNTLTRREEVWHEELAVDTSLPMLVEGEEGATEDVTEGGAESERTNTEVAPLEEQDVTSGAFPAAGGAFVHRPALPPLEADLDAMLHVDRYRRAAFQDHFLGAQTTLENLRRGQHPELGDFVDGAYQLIDVDDDGEEVHVSVAREGVCMDGDRQHLVRVGKSYRFYRDRPGVDVGWEITNRLAEPFQSRFAVEINLGLDGAFIDRYLEIPGRGVFPLDFTFEERDVMQLHWVLRDRRRRVRLQWASPATLYHYPVMVPVRTRLGYRAGFQGTCLILAWDVSLWGGEKIWQEVSLEIEEEP